MKDKREQLAYYAHGAWSHWMKYLFSRSVTNQDGSVTLPKEAVDRWRFQVDKTYDELPEEMRPSDRRQADKILAIVEGK